MEEKTELNNCEYCGKLTTKKRFCSKKCICGFAGTFGCIKANITNKKNKTGFFNPDVNRKAREKSLIICKRDKKSFYNKDIQHRIHEKLKKSKNSSFYDRNIQIMNGLKTQATLRHNIRNLKFYGQYYDSNSEIEISLCLQNQFNYIPKENKTLHVRIGRCEYDYLLEKFKLYIEYHPWDLKFTEKEYYNRRRENLNENGYKDYNLVVIK
jgi:hypothetical protein